MTAPDVIQAERQDVAAMVALLAAAFVDEPAISWILPDPADRQARLTTFFAPIIKGTMRHGLALRAPGGGPHVWAMLWR